MGMGTSLGGQPPLASRPCSRPLRGPAILRSGYRAPSSTTWHARCTPLSDPRQAPRLVGGQGPAPRPLTDPPRKHQPGDRAVLRPGEPPPRDGLPADVPPHGRPGSSTVEASRRPRPSGPGFREPGEAGRSRPAREGAESEGAGDGNRGATGMGRSNRRGVSVSRDQPLRQRRGVEAGGGEHRPIRHRERRRTNLRAVLRPSAPQHRCPPGEQRQHDRKGRGERHQDGS